MSHLCGTLGRVPTTKPRIQVTFDPELASAVAELGGTKSRAQAVHDLALRGAEAVRDERSRAVDAREHLRRIATGQDNRYDFAVSEQLRDSR